MNSYQIASKVDLKFVILDRYLNSLSQMIRETRITCGLQTDHVQIKNELKFDQSTTSVLRRPDDHLPQSGR